MEKIPLPNPLWDRVASLSGELSPEEEKALEKERAAIEAHNAEVDQWRYEQKKIAARLRFKILQKYNFTCQYCGAKAPEVRLHVEHIKPISKGGASEESNLIVACADCNLGKSDSLLDVKPDSLAA